MIEFTKVSRSLFRKSRKFKALDERGKFLYLYLLVNEHINSAGCYQLDEGYALTDLEWSAKRFHETMEKLNTVGLVSWKRERGTVLIEGWVTYNEPVSAKHALGQISCLREVDDLELGSKRFDELRPLILGKKLSNDRAVGGELSRLILDLANSKFRKLPLLPFTETTDGDRDSYETETLTGSESGETALPPAPEGRGVAPLVEDNIRHLLNTPLMRKTA